MVGSQQTNVDLLVLTFNLIGRFKFISETEIFLSDFFLNTQAYFVTINIILLKCFNSGDPSGDLRFLCFQLDLKLNSEAGGDLSTYIQNGEWEVIGRSILLLTQTQAIGTLQLHFPPGAPQSKILLPLKIGSLHILSCHNALFYRS